MGVTPNRSSIGRDQLSCITQSVTTRLINTPFPYRMRTAVFRTLRPDDYSEYQWLREHTMEGCEHSLEGYIKHRCIFVHVPKCAGIAVAQSLFGNHGGHHMGIRQYQLAFTEAEFSNFFKFTFVRNPWDRLYSAYRYLEAGGRHIIAKEWFDRELRQFGSFREFVLRWLNEQSVNSYLHFVPQHRFLVDCRNRQCLDFVGRFEHLERDFAHVCRQLGIERKLEVRNVTKGSAVPSYRDAYDQESTDIVARIYRRDIELFGYEF